MLSFLSVGVEIVLGLVGFGVGKKVLLYFR